MLRRQKKLESLILAALMIVVHSPQMQANDSLEAKEVDVKILVAKCGTGCAAVSYPSGGAHVNQDPSQTYNPPPAKFSSWGTSSTQGSDTYNTNRSYNVSPDLRYGSETYRSTPIYTPEGYISPAAPTTRTYGNEADYQRNTTMTMTASQRFTDTELYSMLSREGKKVWNQLDRLGKDDALELASQDSYKDKDLAVKEAKRMMDERLKNSPR